jgi:predicted MPP superfamily phosphohydrolase
LLGLAAASSSILGSLAYSYARYVEPKWLDESYQRVPLSGKGGLEKFKGFRLAFLSDMHLSTTGRPLPIIKYAFKRVLEIKPDMVALGGDHFNKGVWNPAMADLVCPLTEAGINVVGIMGNHDYFGRRRDPERIIQHMRQIGVKFLRNQACEIEYKGARAWIVGMDDFDRGEPDLDEATERMLPQERPLLVLAHNPDYTPELPRDYTELVLSGHTHGGQINPVPPPFNERFNWVRYTHTSHRTRYPQGWYNVKGNRLYVSRGIGMSGFRLRFNARPELSLFEFV